MKKYWEEETPKVVDTGKNVLRLFDKAGKLQVAQPDWEDKDGMKKPGKTVTVDLDALRETPEAVEIIRAITE